MLPLEALIRRYKPEKQHQNLPFRRQFSRFLALVWDLFVVYEDRGEELTLKPIHQIIAVSMIKKNK